MAVERALAVVGAFTLVSLGLTGALRLVRGRNHSSEIIPMHRFISTLFGSWRRRGATLAGVLVLSAGGVALAAWLFSATGTGTGQIGTLSATVSAGPTPGDSCLPGGSCSASFQVVNPNGAPIQIVSLAANGAALDTPSPNCVASISVNTSAVGAGSGMTPITVPTGTTTVTVPKAYALAASAPSSCAGTAFSMPMTVNFSAGS